MKLVPRYFQWIARAPKVVRRLQGFLPRQGLILGVDSSCPVSREKRQGCIKECLKVGNSPKTSYSLGVIYRKIGGVIAGMASIRPSKPLALQNLRQWELPVAGSQQKTPMSSEPNPNRHGEPSLQKKHGTWLNVLANRITLSVGKEGSLDEPRQRLFQGLQHHRATP